MGRVAINNSVSLDDSIIGRNPSVGRCGGQEALAGILGTAAPVPDWDGTGRLRSLPAKQHLPKARPAAA
jgi:hypothetical protein